MSQPDQQTRAEALKLLADKAISHGVGFARVSALPKVLFEAIDKMNRAGMPIEVSLTGNESLERFVGIMNADPSRLFGESGYLADHDLDEVEAVLMQQSSLGLDIKIGIPSKENNSFGDKSAGAIFANQAVFRISISPQGAVSYQEQSKGRLGGTGIIEKLVQARSSAWLTPNAAAAKAVAAGLQDAAARAYRPEMA